MYLGKYPVIFFLCYVLWIGIQKFLLSGDFKDFGQARYPRILEVERAFVPNYGFVKTTGGNLGQSSVLWKKLKIS